MPTHWIPKVGYPLSVLSRTDGLISDDCTCFYSALSKTSIFQPATIDGPSDLLGTISAEFREDIENFLATKRTQHAGGVASQPDAGKAQLYCPLGKGETRVIEIYSAEPDANLKGKLHVVSIDFAYQKRWEQPGRTYRTRITNHAISMETKRPFWYTALSYTWGVPNFEQSIIFEHGSVDITSSLAAALRHLRLSDQSIFLWVDQICINQRDEADKAQQILLMGDIYAHATNTVIWLGEDTDANAALAYDTMETVYARLQGTEARVESEDDFKRLDFPHELDASWWAVLQLLRKPWFSRLWVIQEVVLSRQLFIKCGTSVACWDDFAVWCYTLHESGLLQWLSTDEKLDQKHFHGDFTGLPPPSGARIVDLLQSDRSKATTTVQKAYLLELLVSTRYASATQQKDKVYGLLGMAEHDITVDNCPTTTHRKVYHDACLTQLPHLGYELISCVDHDAPLKPSWVPDWSRPRETEALGYLTKARALYSAGGPISRSFDAENKEIHNFTISGDGSELSNRGKIVDTVTHVGLLCTDPKLDIEGLLAGFPELISYIDMVNMTYQTSVYVSPGTTVFDAFLNTILAGRDGSGTVAPGHDHSEVFSLIVDAMTGHMDSVPGQTYSPRRKKGFLTLQSLKARKPAKTLEDLTTALRAALKMRRFAITKKGYFALVPRGTQTGDVIVVIQMACVPFVMRSVSKDVAEGRFELLGECYVQGIMRGEVMADKEIDLQHITLV